MTVLLHNSSPKIFVALDFSTAKDALSFVDKLSADQCGLKVGKELFTREGPALVRRLVERQFPVFLDLKFHDIPNTVSRATAAAADLGVWMINVHASGGRAMMVAASESLQSFGKDRPLLTAVTVLTSMSQAELIDIGVKRSLSEQVSALSALAAESGVDGVVCSAQEASILRRERGQDFLLVTPGIRLASVLNSKAVVTGDDQVRVVTPRQAFDNGADYLVIGRPVTQASDPLQILRTINEEISHR